MRVLVTRARAEAERTGARLSALGHEALIAPVTRIVRTGEPRPEGPWDALIVTSAHACPALADAPDRHCPVFAVGERTGEALRRAGFTAVAVAGGDAASLSALVRGRLGPGGRLLYVAGRHRKAEPAASLRAAGFLVDTWEAYAAEAAETLPLPAIEALRTGRIAAALHYSRRSAEILLRLAREAGLASALQGVAHPCLSADVACAFAGSGARTIVAARPDEEALLELLAKL